VVGAHERRPQNSLGHLIPKEFDGQRQVLMVAKDKGPTPEIAWQRSSVDWLVLIGFGTSSYQH
jgi:hypothetical protein